MVKQRCESKRVVVAAEGRAKRMVEIVEALLPEGREVARGGGREQGEHVLIFACVACVAVLAFVARDELARSLFGVRLWRGR